MLTRLTKIPLSLMEDCTLEFDSEPLFVSPSIPKEDSIKRPYSSHTSSTNDSTIELPTASENIKFMGSLALKEKSKMTKSEKAKIERTKLGEFLEVAKIEISSITIQTFPITNENFIDFICDTFGDS